VPVNITYVEIFETNTPGGKSLYYYFLISSYLEGLYEIELKLCLDNSMDWFSEYKASTT
jgi:hypothetical protein